MTPEELWDSKGLLTNGIGPRPEWAPSVPIQHQEWHNEFWCTIGAMLADESGDYDDLPDWMTEEGSKKLTANN